MAALPGLSLGIWLTGGGPSSALQGGRGMIPVFGVIPGLKPCWRQPPLIVGFSRGLEQPFGFSSTGMCKWKSWMCLTPALLWLPGNENSPNPGQLLSRPWDPPGRSRAIPGRDSESSSGISPGQEQLLGFLTLPEEPLGCSCLDPGVPLDKPQRNRAGIQ